MVAPTASMNRLLLPLALGFGSILRVVLFAVVCVAVIAGSFFLSLWIFNRLRLAHVWASPVADPQARAHWLEPGGLRRAPGRRDRGPHLQGANRASGPPLDVDERPQRADTPRGARL